MKLGETIRSKRESLGLTQQELAEKLFVTRQTVSRWESGSRCPDLIMSKRIADALGLTLDDLISEDDCTVYEPKKEAAGGMRYMLAGIFLLLLSVWFLINAMTGSALLFGVAAMVLPFPAAGFFILGYFNEAEK